MALADLILKYVPLPSVPPQYTSYIPGKTPLSTPVEVFPALAAYLLVIFSVRAYMKDKPPMKLQFLFQVHNLFLSSGSLLLVTLILEQVIPLVWKQGVFWGMCNEGMWTSVRDSVFHILFRVWRGTFSETRILLYDQLLFQVHRTIGYAFPCFKEKASRYVLLQAVHVAWSLFVESSFPPCLPPFCYCSLVLYTT